MKTLEIFLLPWDQASSSAYPIRQQVFIDEQKVPEELELDEFDPLAIHALAYLGEQCVGTARLVDLGDGQSQVGRMAVLANFRGQGIGKQLLQATLGRARDIGFERVELEVYADNDRAITLYRDAGFVIEGYRHRARKLGGIYSDIITMATFY